jgi:mRNA interferase RelE/StbE
VGGYEIRITEVAAKEIDTLPRKKDRQAVVGRILGLAEDPRPPGYMKLSGHEELYRVRQGPYRIVYTIEDDRLVVIVIRVADRKEAYRETRRTRSLQRTRPFGSRR